MTPDTSGSRVPDRSTRAASHTFRVPVTCVVIALLSSFDIARFPVRWIDVGHEIVGARIDPQGVTSVTGFRWTR